MRAFISAEIPDKIKKAALSIFGEEKAEGIVPVMEDAMHITIAFLGEISKEDAERVALSLKGLRVAPFMASLRGLSSFPEREPRVVFINISSGAEDLEGLHKKASALAKQAINIKRENFVPHLTIARVKSRGGIFLAKEKICENRDRDFGSFEVTSISFKESKLTSSGPIHRELSRIEF